MKSPIFDLTAPDIHPNPYPTFAKMRNDYPLAQAKTLLYGKVLAVTRFDDVNFIHKDPRFSSDIRNSKGIQGALMGLMPGILRLLQDSMVSLDDPSHARLKNLVHVAFTPKVVEQMLTSIQGIANDLLDKNASKPDFDLIADYALPLPLTVISDLMGVEVKDRLNFHHWSVELLDATSGSPAGLLKQIVKGNGMTPFLKGLIAERRVAPREDLISGLVQAELQGDTLNENELLAMLFLVLLAGYETTVNLIGNGILCLLQNPEQYELLRKKPDLMPSTIEEILRYEGPVVHGNPRIPLEPVTLHGQTIPVGTMVIGYLHSANRDENAFPNANTFDITRTQNKHMGFGYGVHYCLGAPLARNEGRLALETLIQRFPNMKLNIPDDKILWRRSVGVRGLASLPLKLN